MAQLTASQTDILFNPTGSLRKMAYSVNQHVTKWYKQLWWQDANIVTSDFFLGNNLISVAIEANIIKGSVDKRYEIMNWKYNKYWYDLVLIYSDKSYVMFMF